MRARTVIADAVVLRPLLDWRRAELRRIVRRAEAPFVDDPANHDPRHDRTRFRQLLDGHEWLGVAQLARAAAQLAEADTDLRATVDWLWQDRAQIDGDNVRIQAADLPRELGRRLARRAIGTVRAAAGIESPAWSEGSNIEKLLEALSQGSRATQAGVIASVRSGVWRFRPAPEEDGLTFYDPPCAKREGDRREAVVEGPGSLSPSTMLRMVPSPSRAWGGLLPPRSH
ncbi:hypothetical protein GCM10020258_07520 [Sphingomonas yabuuchiae]